MTRMMLVDGYNVIFGSELRQLPLEKARESLVVFARIWHPVPVLVVFDGRKDTPFPAVLQGAVFAREQSADEWIMAYIRAHPGTSFVVVTADRPLLDRVRGLGAEVMHPRTFLQGPPRMRKKGRRMQRARDPGLPLSPQERKALENELLQEWLEQQGE